MAEIRTLKLNLLADVNSFSKGLNSASKKTDAWSKGVAKASKLAAAGFAAAGTAVVAYGVQAVKAAAEDEQSQKRLAKALKNTTKATDKQINSTEEWITKTQMLYGVSDSKLRPALARLTQSTGSIAESQQILNTALDVSAGSGKSLEVVTKAIARAYDGSVGALGKLGVALTDKQKKSADFTQIMQILNQQFGGQAQTAAETYAGKIAIMKEKMGEFQESIGAKLIPWLSRALDAIMQVSDGFAGKTGLAKHVGQASDALDGARKAKYEDSWYSVGDALKQVADSFKALFNELNSGNGQDGESAIKSIAGALKSVANAINDIKNAWKGMPAFWKTGEFGPNGMFDITPWSKANSARRKPRALGGPVTAGGSYLVGERGPEIFTPRSSGSITPNSAMGGNTFVFNGVVDGESARRSIERLFQTSSRISGAPNFTGNLS